MASRWRRSSDVGVHRRGHTDVGVPKQLLDTTSSMPCSKSRVAVEKSDRPRAGVAEQGVEVAGEGAGLDRVLLWPREDVPAALPGRARLLLLLCLPGAVCAGEVTQEAGRAMRRSELMVLDGASIGDRSGITRRAIDLARQAPR